MVYNPNRRQFLGLTGTGAAISVAGCSSLNSNNGQADDLEETDDENTDGEEMDSNGAEMDSDSVVTALIQPDQAAIQSRQAEIQEDVQQRIDDGELDELEGQRQMQQEMQAAQTELTEEAVADFESEFEDDDSVTVGDTVPQIGAVLVDGDGNRLIEILNNGMVDGLLPRDDFELAQQQQQQRQQQQPPGSESENSSES